MHYIYCITNKINGKSYVGQTDNIQTRWNRHLNVAFGNNPKTKFILHHALKKYGGRDAFIWQIIEVHDNIDDANEAEEFFISYLNTLIPNGYNIKLGGSNHQINMVTRDKMRKAIKVNRHTSILTVEKVRQIYTRYMNGEKISPLSVEYGVSKGTIESILNKKRWAEDTDDLPPVDAARDRYHIMGGNNQYFTRDNIISLRNEWDIIPHNERGKKIAFLDENVKKYSCTRQALSSVVHRKTFKGVE